MVMRFKYQICSLCIGIFTLNFMGCSDQSNKNLPVSNTTAKNTSSMPSLRVIIEPDSERRLKGDYVNVSYELGSAPKQKTFESTMNCKVWDALKDHPGNEIDCTSHANIRQISPGVYRILVIGGKKGWLACDIFKLESATNNPQTLILNSSTAGDCILVQLMTETGYSESEIRNRVRHILNGAPQQQFDLQLTLFDLLSYYDTMVDAHGWADFKAAIKKDVPLKNTNNNSTIAKPS